MIPIVLLTTEHVPEKTLHVFVYIEVKKVSIPLKIKAETLMMAVLSSVFSFFRLGKI